MKWNKFPIAVTAAILFLGLTFPAVHAESKVTQRFTLQPGWNAVFIEIQPESRDPAEVFSGLDHLESLWAWLSRESRIEFIQNPSENKWNETGWHVYFKDEPDGFRKQLTNLHAILGNQAYLIKIKEDAPKDITWQISGVPATRIVRWLPDSFNLIGTHINPDNPPTFEAYFSASPAHSRQAIYRMNQPSGNWSLVEDPDSTFMKHGEAFWIFCEGASLYQGPLQADIPMGDGLHYGSSLSSLTVTLSNHSGFSRSVKLSLSGNVALAYKKYETSGIYAGYFVWKDLEEMPISVIGSGRSQNIWLAVRRELMATGLSESVLQIVDDQGIRIQVPVSAERIQ